MEKKYILRNKITGLYWDGRPAPESFQAERKDAKEVTGPEAAFIRATYGQANTEVIVPSKSVATSEEDKKRIDDVYSDLNETMMYLYARWQDEKEYEDIAEYGRVLAVKLPEGFKLIKMSKKPFGFDFSIGTAAVYNMYVNVRSYGWKRIK